MKTVLVTTACAAVLLDATPAMSHCEIPCGIYGDKMRILALKEHIGTVEKSMRQIVQLEQAGKGNANQLVRWVINKEEHAKEIQKIATQYFMFQRVKVPKDNRSDTQKKYTKQLSLLHQILVSAMKMKQTTDVGLAADTVRLVDAFVRAYFSPQDQEHLRRHERTLSQALAPTQHALAAPASNTQLCDLAEG